MPERSESSLPAELVAKQDWLSFPEALKDPESYCGRWPRLEATALCLTRSAITGLGDIEFELPIVSSWRMKSKSSSPHELDDDSRDIALLGEQPPAACR